MANTESHLPPYRIRPRFQIESPLSPEEVISKLKKGLQAPGAVCDGHAGPGFATLTILTSERHYWSPQLTLSVEKLDGGGSLIRGLYGPAPAVWTMFVFFYSLVGFATAAVLITGLSYLSLGMSGAILWWALVLGIILLSLYLVSYFGQRLGHSQMEVLHSFLEEKLGLYIYTVSENVTRSS